MSKHWQPTPSVTAAHAAMLTRLGDLPPHVIRFNTDAVDLDETAEHLQKVLAAVADYVAVTLFHADDNASEPAIGTSRRLSFTESLAELVTGRADLAEPADIMGGIADVTSDIVGACENAADTARGYHA
jgi:hypothetical protein